MTGTGVDPTREVFVNDDRTVAVVIESDGINEDSTTVNVIRRDRASDAWGPPVAVKREEYYR